MPRAEIFSVWAIVAYLLNPGYGHSVICFKFLAPRLSALPLILVALLQVGQANAKPLQVLATTAMVADTVRAVGGDAVSVSTLMQSGVDPHLYTLTRTDMARLLRADIVFYNGLDLEGKMGDVLDRLRRAGKSVVAVTEGLSEESLLDSSQYEGVKDPHVWMDLARWRQTGPVVFDELSRHVPDAQEAMQQYLEQWQAQLALLQAWIEGSINSLPEAKRVLVTAHDAFAYFGEAYAFEVIGIQGVNTEAEAGLQRIESLVRLLSDRRIPTVFVESSVSSRNVEALIDGAAAIGHTVTLGGELYSDAMGQPGTAAGTYLGMITHNVATIVLALGGQVPDLPAELEQDLSTLVNAARLQK